MSVLQRVVKPTTRKGKKFLLKREPQVVEGPKRALFLQGRKSSEKLRSVLKDFYDIKKPDAHLLTKKNDITIFENVTPVETFCKKYDTSLFVLASHSKKRPDNVVFGRIFNYSLLDMIELYVESYQGFKDFPNSKILLGSKPCLVFNGPLWKQKEELIQLKSIFIDFFHRDDVDTVRLQGLEHVLSFTVGDEGKILLRSYKVLLKKSGTSTPRVELEEIGPRVEFSLRRSKLPTEDLMKEACRRPKELKVTQKKNISSDGLGNIHGRIHLGKQEIYKLQTRKMKGLKKTAEERKTERAAKRSAPIENDDAIKKQKIG